MTLIIVLASLLLEWLFGQYHKLRSFAWFSHYRDFIQHRILPKPWRQSVFGLLFLLAPLSLFAWLVQLASREIGAGILEAVFGVLVLSYCFGPKSLYEQIRTYLNARETEDVDCDPTSDGTDDPNHSQAIAEQIVEQTLHGQNLHQQTRAVTTGILYAAHRRVFAILFWFVLLGPGGALLYRLCGYAEQDSRTQSDQAGQQAAQQILGILDWLPARLLALTFFLAGSFEDAWQGWRKAQQYIQRCAAEMATDSAEQTAKAVMQRISGNRIFLLCTGCGAMRHEVDDIFATEHHGETEHHNKQDQMDYDLQWVRTARSLVLRSLMIWLAVIAVLTMSGWFV